MEKKRKERGKMSKKRKNEKNEKMKKNEKTKKQGKTKERKKRKNKRTEKEKQKQEKYKFGHYFNELLMWRWRVFHLGLTVFFGFRARVANSSSRMWT